MPRVAVIGFGMSGVGALHALRHLDRFVADPGAFKAEVAVFEAASNPGGKAAPENLGAQFLDAEALYPFDRILASAHPRRGPRTRALRCPPRPSRARTGRAMTLPLKLPRI